ncbi:hypothetical protein Tco_0033932 [Tanacetum coccineum]
MSQPANDEFSQHLSDDEASNHEDASNTGAAPKQQQVIPQTTAISNIKLPIMKKEEYDIWAIEMEHYLEYIRTIDILSVIRMEIFKLLKRNGRLRNILLMPFPRSIWKDFHGKDDGKRDSGKPSELERVRKGYDRFPYNSFLVRCSSVEYQLEDAIHMFSQSLPAWVFEQEIQGASKTSSSAQNVAFVSQSKRSTNKVKSGFTGAYSTCTPSTSLTNIHEKEVLAGFVIRSYFIPSLPNNQRIGTCFMKGPEQIDKLGH